MEYVCDGVQVDVGAVLRSLPTKEDIYAMLLKIEETHRREMQEIWGDVQQLSARVGNSELSQGGLQTRLNRVEEVMREKGGFIIAMKLQLDYGDCNYRNNLQLRDILELVDTPVLARVATDLFRELLEITPDTVLKVDAFIEPWAPAFQIRLDHEMFYAGSIITRKRKQSYGRPGRGDQLHTMAIK